MCLYSQDDGLTRLRFLVFGFIIFEALGLLATFYYIIKPAFNIAAVYLCVALAYYLILNIVPVDYYVAGSQIDRYLDGKAAGTHYYTYRDRGDVSSSMYSSLERGGLDYVMTLSPDAAPQIARLLEYEETKEISGNYLKNKEKYYYTNAPYFWQKYNLSIERLKIYAKALH
jgi:hypothetical protein